MAAQAEMRNSLGRNYGVIERGSTRHQRCGSHDPMRVRFDDGAIDAGSESEIICIDDQTAHGVSLAG